MVSPVYSRPNKSIELLTSGVHTYSESKTNRSAQKAPFSVNTEWDHRVGNYAQNVYSGNYYGSTYPVSGSQAMSTFRYVQSLADETINKSYDKLKGRVYTSTQLGVDFVEYRRSLASITKASTTLFQAIRHVKSFRFIEAAKVLRMHYVPKGVSKRKSFANNWLEFHFGWEPLYQDIHDSLEILNNPINAFMKVRGSSKLVRTVTETQDYGSVIRTTTYTDRHMTVQGCAVKAINNVGLHSLDQFGLLNPLSIAWELVPFSFAVDWFANVGQVLSTFSDFAGMTLQGQFSYFVYTVAQRSIFNVKPQYAVPGWIPLQCYGTGTAAVRHGYLLQPVFNVKRLRLPSKVRALTAVSLVTQQLKGR